MQSGPGRRLESDPQYNAIAPGDSCSRPPRSLTALSPPVRQLLECGPRVPRPQGRRSQPHASAGAGLVREPSGLGASRSSSSSSSATGLTIAAAVAARSGEPLQRLGAPEVRRGGRSVEPDPRSTDSPNDAPARQSPFVARELGHLKLTLHWTTRTTSTQSLLKNGRLAATLDAWPIRHDLFLWLPNEADPGPRRSRRRARSVSRCVRVVNFRRRERGSTPHVKSPSLERALRAPVFRRYMLGGSTGLFRQLRCSPPRLASSVAPVPG